MRSYVDLCVLLDEGDEGGVVCRLGDEEQTIEDFVCGALDGEVCG